jgi:transcription-repair coupling factor (superfamily II helicase)
VIKEKAGLMLVPRPRPAQIGGPQIKDAELLLWCTEVINSVLLA